MTQGLTMAKPRRQNGGRYHQRAVAIPDGLEREGRHLAGKREVVHVSMDDPNPAMRKPFEPPPQQMVAKNGRVSPLEYEFATRRISEGAYRMGREIERALEITSPGSGGQWRDGDRTDAASAHENAIAYSIDDARRAVAKLEWMRGYLSERTVKIVVMVIRDMELFTEVARKLGWKRTQRKVADAANCFRDALETLAEKAAARGARQ